ncbi:YrdB family protein [Cellulomonas sp. URHD0024]|uniref:YrdB family protein n=1 Tax=Cellulomonas sp. URHD0024 TaxID=1302620 RepID=UPI00040BF7DA|nr:YrdB family protein [Cellulomonas sp. URHD0024]
MTEPAPTQQIGALDVLAFLLELTMVVLLAVAGWRLGSSTVTYVGLAVAFVVVAVTLWGRWMAPRSAHRLPGTARAVLATGLFATTAVVALLAGVSAFVTLPFAVLGATVFVATRNA